MCIKTYNNKTACTNVFPDDEQMVTYASETWVLKENMINKLMTFESKIMRKMYGPIRTEDGYWRIKNNQEINDTLKGQNIIGFIKKTNTKLVRPC
jgi:hypothetical protein